jgi:TolB-like protein/DNA-binding winged helix-turn-helix (wHTH) protein/Flp pilus assembly protein TadD
VVTTSNVLVSIIQPLLLGASVHKPGFLIGSHSCNRFWDEVLPIIPARHFESLPLAGNERVAIPPKTYDLLRFLVENPERLISREELLKALWPDTFVNPEILRKYVQDLRKILGDRPDKPIFIETVPKRGYRFVAPIVDEDTSEQATVPDAVEIGVSDVPLSPSRKKFYILPTASLLIAIVAITAVAYVWFGHNRNRAPVLRDPSIAVLPFVDMSPGQDQGYFSDGLSEELINDLAKVPGLKVVARSSSFQFKARPEDLRIVGKKLGVANVLEGSLRREGDRIRITAELIEADNAFQIWSGTYDRDVSNIVTTQDEIAAAVTGALQSKLLSSGGAAIAGTPRETNPAAYQAYLEGQYFVARGQNEDAINKALSYADQVIKLDAGYAPGWAQRSVLFERLARLGLIENSEGFRRARQSADKAIALDPRLAASYLALALVQIDYDWDWEGANASLQKAGQLEPGSAAVLGMQAHLARMQGHLEEAVGLYRQAIALDPLRANFHLALGDKLYDLGRYAEAKIELDKAEELHPQLSGLHLTRSKILFTEGQQPQALEEVEKEPEGWQKLSGEALVYFALGRLVNSDNALTNLVANHQNEAAYQVAEAYAFRAETDKAFQWLERAFRQRDPGTPEMNTNPLMKSLRQDPRYAKLLTQMHLDK